MKKINYRNYILLIVFLLVIYVPTILYFFVDDSSKRETLENRNLNSKPHLAFNTINEYPAEYEKYYNDNLPFRSYLISSYRSLVYKLFSESNDSRVILGKDTNGDSWFFYNNMNDSDPISFIDGRKIYSPQTANEYINSVKNQTNILKKHNINLYYLVIPNKSSMYSEYLPDNINVSNDSFKELYNQMINSKITNLYYPYDYMKEESKKNELYYRTDTHWNKYGAYLVAKKLLNKIYPNKQLLENNKIDFSYTMKPHTDLYNFMGINIRMKENNFNVKYDGKVNKSIDEETKIETYTNDDYKINETVLLVGDSYTTNMIEPLTSTYKRVIRIFQNLTIYKQEFIDKYKPTKVFYVLVERDTNYGLNQVFYK